MRVEHLSAEDATIWCAQSPEAPLQLGGLALCAGAALRDESGAIPIERIRRHFETRLVAMPRFRKRLTSVPLGQGLVWVDDDRFEIARHMRLAALPRPGTEEQLREFVARLLETPFAPGRPLWEFWIVEGVSGDRVALVPKVSHIMGDGMAILSLVLSMFDFEPRRHDDPPQPWAHLPAPSTAAMLLGTLYERSRRQVGAVGQVGRALAHPSTVPARTAALVRAGSSLLAAAAPLPIARPVGPRRDFAWVRLSLPDLERVKHAQGVKLNDVVLAVTAAGLSRYLQGAGTRVDRLRAVVPVSVHGVNPAGEIENRFTMMFVDVVDAPDPLERLRRVHEETTRGKESLQTSLATVALTLGGLVPQRLLRALAPRLLHHQPFVNVVVTNLAGSRQAMYLFESRLLEMYPFVTVTANLTVMIGVVSYVDTLGVGITVDADAVPDVPRLAGAIREAAGELVAAAASSATP
jgi:WS/DGAT/MGAT family acyltransferase